jgi:hypothetical protein
MFGRNRRTGRISPARRKRRAFFTIAGIKVLTFIVYSYKSGLDKEPRAPKMVFGIPAYQDARFSSTMSSLNGNPYIAVFLSADSYEVVLRFYKDYFQKEPKVIEYGQRSIVAMRIFQFELEKGPLPDSIDKGVEIIPLNSRSQRIHKARTKIKIIIPRKEVVAEQLKQKAEQEKNN